MTGGEHGQEEGLSAKQRNAIDLMRRCAGHDSGWAVISSQSTASFDGQAWIHWRTALALVDRDLAEHDDDMGLIRLWEHGPEREEVAGG